MDTNIYDIEFRDKDGKAVTLDQSVTIELEKAAQIRLHIDF